MLKNPTNISGFDAQECFYKDIIISVFYIIVMFPTLVDLCACVNGVMTCFICCLYKSSFVYSGIVVLHYSV